jgi:phosphoglycolate phosphatase-like HAD superfamily hydrolase
MKKVIPILLVILFLYSCAQQQKQQETIQTDPLPSWNEGITKQAITDYVMDVTKEESDNFIPVSDRIATFDNDGTLWTEKPLYIPVEYEINYLKKVVPSNPDLQKNKLYAKLAEGNVSILKDYSSFDLINALFVAHSGQSEADYQASVYTFLSEETHTRFNRPYKELVYQPMVELVHYLQANKFKVYIVTGGEISFARTVSQEIYNIPPEQVIGSSVVLEYVSNSNDTYLKRTGQIQSINDKHFKPANIGLHIGKKPIFAAGNSDGDYEMMQYTLSGEGPSMAILVNHDDEEREYSYMHGTEKAIAHADSIGWHVVSMKKEFKTIFPLETE